MDATRRSWKLTVGVNFFWKTLARMVDAMVRISSALLFFRIIMNHESGSDASGDLSGPSHSAQIGIKNSNERK